MKQTTETARVAPEPLVTVLLPVFNGETHLAAAIDSVLAQTYANLELVVIDDGSTDSTAAIIAGYDDPRLIAARNSVNLGIVRGPESRAQARPRRTGCAPRRRRHRGSAAARKAGRPL